MSSVREVVPPGTGVSGVADAMIKAGNGVRIILYERSVSPKSLEVEYVFFQTMNESAYSMPAK